MTKEKRNEKEESISFFFFFFFCSFSLVSLRQNYFLFFLLPILFSLHKRHRQSSSNIRCDDKTKLLASSPSFVITHRLTFSFFLHLREKKIFSSSLCILSNGKTNFWQRISNPIRIKQPNWRRKKKERVRKTILLLVYLTREFIRHRNE